MTLESEAASRAAVLANHRERCKQGNPRAQPSERVPSQSRQSRRRLGARQAGEAPRPKERSGRRTFSRIANDEHTAQKPSKPKPIGD